MNDLTAQKRIIYIVLGIIILGFFGFLLYRFFAPQVGAPGAPQAGVTGRVQPTTPAGTGEKRPEELQPGETIEIGPEQKLIKLTDFSIVSPSLNKNEDKILFYKKDGGDLYSSDFKGAKLEKISNLTILGLVEAVWSPARDRAAVFYLDQETLKAFIHIGTSSVAILPQDLKSFSWSPDGRSLGYLLPKDDKLSLIIGDSSGKNTRTVYSTPLLDAKINWVSSDKIIFSTAPSGLVPGFIFSFSRASGDFVKLVGPFFGLTSLWSPDGLRTLVSTTGSGGKNLKITVGDSAGKEQFDPGVKTMADKCVWSGPKEAYCAVPENIFPDTIWPDDYLQGAVNTSDSIVYLNLDKKDAREIFNQENFDISNLIVSKDKNYLFFVNRTDGTLWALKLK